MSMNITLDINGKIIRKIQVWNCHPKIISPKDAIECPYQISDDVTEEKFFIVHDRRDGAAVLVQKALERVVEYEQEIKFLGG